jgi:mRNA interferase YafQ
MYVPIYTKQFSKDVKKMQKRKKNLEKIKMIIRSLIVGEQLDPLHQEHKLVGNYQGRRECHIEADWLLIYKVEGDQIIFERTGTHSDLFRR